MSVASRGKRHSVPSWIRPVPAVIQRWPGWASTRPWKHAGPDASHTRARTWVQPWLPAVTPLLGSRNLPAPQTILLVPEESSTNHCCLPSKHGPLGKVLAHTQSQPLTAFWGSSHSCVLAPLKPEEGGGGPAAMQGARERALLSVEQRRVLHPAKTGTFSSFPTWEAPLRKNTQHLCFWSCAFFLFFDALLFMDCLSAFFNFKAVKTFSGHKGHT